MIGDSHRDERVVEMVFDNDEFEKDIAKSRQSLQEFDKSLAEMGGAEGLKGVGDAAKNVNPSIEGIASSVENLSSRFSALGIIGKRVLENITDKAMSAVGKMTSFVTSGVIQGGINRALNLEQAQFQIEGLGMNWEAILDDVSYAVDGTAYSLDVAAKAASMFGASGVKAGDDMKRSLRAISGVAAMSGDSYESVADVFTKVAGQGRLMGDDLNRLATRGVNAAATLGKQFGKTEAEIRDMVKHGEISFEMFAKSMDDAFGEHAKDANKTFSGALSNMKAALSRIGAKVATPALTNLRDIFNEIRPKINEANEALQPFIDGINLLQGIITRKFVKNIKLINFDGLKDFATGNDWLTFLDNFRLMFERIAERIRPVRQALSDVFFSEGNSNTFKSFNQRLHDFLLSLKMTDLAAQGLRSTFRGLFSLLHMTFAIITQLMRGLRPLGIVFGDAESGIFAVTGTMGDFIYEADQFITSTDVVYKGVKRLCEYLVMVPNRVMTAARQFDEALKKYTGVSLFDEFAKLENYIYSIQQGIFNTLLGKGYDYTAMDGFGVALTYLQIKGGELLTDLDKVYKHVQKIFNYIFSREHTLEEKMTFIKSSFMTYVANPVRDFFKQKFQFNFDFSSIENFLNVIEKWLTDIRDNSQGFKRTFIDSILKVVNFLKSHEEDITKWTNRIRDVFGNLRNFLIDFFEDFSLKKAIKYGILALIIYELGKFALSIGSFAVKIKASFGDVLDSIALLFKAKAIKEGSVVIQRFANLVLALAGSLVVLSLIPKDRLKDAVDSLGALIIIVGAFATAIAWFNSKKLAASGNQLNIKLFNDTAQKMFGLATVFASLGGALLSVVPLLLIFKNMNEKEFDQALGGVSGIMFVMIGLVGLASTVISAVGSSGKRIIAFGMVLDMLAFALDALIPIIEVMAHIDGDSEGWEKWWKSLLGVLALVIEIASPIIILGIFGQRSGKQIIAAGMTMDMMAFALNMMIPVIEILGRIPEDVLDQGMRTVKKLGALLGLLTLAMSLNMSFATKSGKGFGLGAATGKQIIASGIMMNLMVSALWGLIPPIMILGNLPLATVGQGVVAVAISLLAIAGAGKIASGAVIGLGGIALVLGTLAAVLIGVGVMISGVGSGILSFVKAVGEMSELSSEQAKHSAENFIDFFVTLFSGLGELADAMEASKDDIIRIFTVLLGTLLDAIIVSADKFASAALEIIIRVLEAIDEHVVDIINLIMDILEKVVAMILGFDVEFGNAGDTLRKSLLDRLFDAVGIEESTKEGARKILESLMKHLKAFGQIANGKALLQTIFRSDHTSDAAKVIMDDASSIADAFDKGIEQEINKPERQKTRKDLIKDAAEKSFKQPIIDTVEEESYELKEVFDDALDETTSPLVEKEEEVREMSKNYGRQMTQPMAEEISQGVEETKNNIREEIDELTAKADEEMSKIADTGEKAKESTKEVAKKAGEGIEEGSESVTNSYTKFFNDLSEKIENGDFSSIGTLLGTNITESFGLSLDNSGMTDIFGGKLDEINEMLMGQSEVFGESSQLSIDTMNETFANADFSESMNSLKEQIDFSMQDFPNIMEDYSFDGIKSFIDTFSSNLPMATDAGEEFKEYTANGVSDKTTKYFPKNADESAKSHITKLLSYEPSLEDAGKKLKAAVVSGLGDLPKELSELAKNAMDGFIEGLNSRMEEVEKIAAKITDIAAKSAAAAQQSASPSKVWMHLGEYAGEGYVIGLSNMSSAVKTASSNLSEEAIEYMNSITRDIYNYINNSDIDLSPTIKPVLDMSDVEEGLNGFGGSIRTLNVSSINAKAGSISARLNASRSLSSTSTDVEGMSNAGGTTMNFTQNNYSPRSLSRIDIYRQTRNLFAQTKGLVEGT